MRSACWGPLKRGSKAANGFEPLNEAFAELCLTTWPCRQKKNGQSRDRTNDTRIFSPLLYLLSYGTPLELACKDRINLVLQKLLNKKIAIRDRVCIFTAKLSDYNGFTAGCWKYYYQSGTAD